MSVRTYQARAAVAPKVDAALASYAALHGRVKRSLFAALQAGRSHNEIKRSFLVKFGITARQFNAARIDVQGIITGQKNNCALRIASLNRQIKDTESFLKKHKNLNPLVAHGKKRRLAALRTRLAALEACDKPHICFGTKDLFNAQFGDEYKPDDPEDKEEVEELHAKWKKEWDEARNDQFFVIGSKDENGGCVGCTATLMKDGSITLRLRLPDVLRTVGGKAGKYITFENIRFAYGQEAIEQAINRNLSGDGVALSYRFQRDEKGWRVLVSTDVSGPSTLFSIRGSGVIGVDINAEHLAITETDRNGNPISKRTIPCCTYGKSTDQASAIIGGAVKQLLSLAVTARKPIVLEDLDFTKKKATLRSQSPRFARMLSSLAYSQIQATIRARSFDSGIEVLSVNPAYTSTIGKHKFSRRYGLSTHHAAALVIGRRADLLSERLPSQLHGTLPESVRKRGRHVWSLWAEVLREEWRMQRRRGPPNGSRSGTKPRAKTTASSCRRDSGTQATSTVRVAAMAFE